MNEVLRDISNYFLIDLVPFGSYDNNWNLSEALLHLIAWRLALNLEHFITITLNK